LSFCLFSGGVDAIVSLLESKVEHVLVNTVNAIRVLVEGNMNNQTTVANSDAVVILIDLLGKQNCVGLSVDIQYTGIPI
jgi:hypothetical protein